MLQLTYAVGVVSLTGQNGRARAEVIEQAIDDLSVVRLTCCQAEPDGEPLRVDDNVNFGREPTVIDREAAELNESGGILGRPIELLAADAGGSPDAVVERCCELVERDDAEVLAGVHLSSVRVALSEAFAGKIAYVFAPLYEGGEERAGVFAIGDVPEQQFPGPVRRLMENRKARRWFIVGNDYVWPCPISGYGRSRFLERIGHSQTADAAHRWNIT